jgi:outer membrane protein OmpA-like peptidoglycan-associated protein
MAREYSWESSGTYTPPPRQSLGWYVLVAVILALSLHLAALVLAGNTFYRTEIAEPAEWVSEPIRLVLSENESEEVAEKPPEDELERPIDDSDLADDPEAAITELRDLDIDLSTDLEELSLPEMRIEKPTLAGATDGDELRPTIGPNVNPEIPDPGKVEIDFPEAKKGQIVVDRGRPLADVLDPNAAVRELGRARGGGGKDAEGVIEGYTGLADYANMSPGELARNKATIGSDLLFEFNSATLREDARFTLLTVAQLIDRNPGMYCWVEGHTDLIGSEEANLALSRRRGQAVKDWLVRSLQLDPDFIVVRAFGMSEPIVREGDKEAQAPNRRVDIKMRKDPPKTTEIRPGRAIVVPEEEEIPKAEVVPEDGENIPRGVIVPDEEIPRGIIVPEEEIPRALPVDE